VAVFLFFFFQAEDGIRDRNVTGVQTCALPIWSPPLFSTPNSGLPWTLIAVLPSIVAKPLNPSSLSISFPSLGAVPASLNGHPCRSEERRVGKECRVPSSPWHLTTEKHMTLLQL